MKKIINNNSVDTSFCLVIFLITVVGIVAIIHSIDDFSRGIFNRTEIITIILVPINFLCFSIYLFFLFLKKKSYRLLISLPFTVYALILTKETAFFYYIAIIAMLVGILMLMHTNISKKKRAILLSSVVIIYICLAIFQQLKIISIHYAEIEDSFRATIICLFALFICFFSLTYALGNKEKINIVEEKFHANILAAKEENSYTINRFSKNNNCYEAVLIVLLNHNYKYKDIAEALDLTLPKIRNDISKLYVKHSVRNKYELSEIEC